MFLMFPSTPLCPHNHPYGGGGEGALRGTGRHSKGAGGGGYWGFDLCRLLLCSAPSACPITASAAPDPAFQALPVPLLLHSLSGFGLLRNAGKIILETRGQAEVFPAIHPNSAKMALGWPPSVQRWIQCLSGTQCTGLGRLHHSNVLKRDTDSAPDAVGECMKTPTECSTECRALSKPPHHLL